MVGATKYKTKADEERMTLIVEIGCIACMIHRKNGTPCQVHHVTSCGHRLEDEHRWTIGLCPWHHAGEVPYGLSRSVTEATKRLGPSLHHDKRLFKQTFGAEEELVIVQDSLIRCQLRERGKGRYLDPGQLGRLAILMHREVVEHRSPDYYSVIQVDTR